MRPDFGCCIFRHFPTLSFTHFSSHIIVDYYSPYTLPVLPFHFYSISLKIMLISPITSISTPTPNFFCVFMWQKCREYHGVNYSLLS